MNKYDKMQVCKLVAMAVSADGRVVDEEYELLDRIIDYYELDKAQQQAIYRREFDFNPAVLTREISTDEARAEMLSAVALAVAVDGEVVEKERWLIDCVARTMGVEKEEVDALLRRALDDSE